MDPLIKIATFSSRLEAETIGNALEQYGIPFFVRSEDLGIFGPGHTGATPQGATLWIPVESADQAKELLSCLFQPEKKNDTDD